MKKRIMFVFAVMALGLMMASVGNATTITFSEFAVGTLIDNEYAAQGVLFQAGTNGNLPIIAYDSAMPGSPVLSPNPAFAGDFTMVFLGGATGVSFASGYWDALSRAVVQVYDLSDVLLATLTNTSLGVYTFNLAAYGTIGKIYFDSRPDPAGGDIDNLSFTSVPEPATLLLLGFGLLGLAGVRRNKK